MSRDAFVEAVDVSRETLERFDAYATTLAKWNDRINLVAPSTLNDVWTRHFLDSAQLWRPDLAGQQWLDLGAGAGFPGLVIAILAAERLPDTPIALIEADVRKAAFLRAVTGDLGLAVEVIAERIERASPRDAGIVSARACAPLVTLLGHAYRHLSPGGQALFLKGRRYRSELTEANQRWHMNWTARPSVTDAQSAVLTVTGIEERA
ncbi:MAG: 16S rRNA (guanine(527)-N(7))-methyltransferase RsmG [Paracoccaceae bacterium]